MSNTFGNPTAAAEASRSGGHSIDGPVANESSRTWPQISRIAYGGGTLIIDKSKDYELIGGWNHGETVAVDESATRLESPVYEDENHLKEPFRSETYTKRRFAGEEFGDGYECYGLLDDDGARFCLLTLGSHGEHGYLLVVMQSRIRRNISSRERWFREIR